MKRSLWTAAFAFAVMGGISELAAQQPVRASAPSRVLAPGGAPSAAVRGWMAELQQISGRVQAAHSQAMQDAALRASQEALFREMKAEMERADPGLGPLAARMEEMEAEARRARQSGDRARLETLTREARQIQMRFLGVQTRVVQKPALAAKMRRFEVQLHQKMLQVEPQLDGLLQRSKQLRAQIGREVGKGRPPS